MQRRFLNDKRGVTPVLSTLLLTVVAVAAMTIATTATYVITNNLRDTMSERAAIEDIWFNNQTHTIDVYVRNIGKTAIQVTAVYVNHTSQDFTEPFTLEIGQHTWLNIYKAWTSGSLYHIDMVTTRGTHVEEYSTAP
jgi:Flp pilus assembly pilin Flp